MERMTNYPAACRGYGVITVSGDSLNMRVIDEFGSIVLTYTISPLIVCSVFLVITNRIENTMRHEKILNRPLVEGLCPQREPFTYCILH